MHKKSKNYWTFMLKCTNIELTVKRNKKQEGNKRMKGNVIVGQSGGPTAAINASLAGVYRTAKDRGANKVYGMLHGIQGLLKEKYIDLSDHIKTELDAELLKRTPAAFLGSCRYKLPEIHENREVYDKIFEILDKLDIEVFIYIGGNDSMDTIKKLSDYAIIFGHAIRFIGCPKTIDNDLALTDHTPGYGSAAKYIGTSMKEIIRDSFCLEYEKGVVSIVEIMGRNAGWLHCQREKTAKDRILSICRNFHLIFSYLEKRSNNYYRRKHLLLLQYQKESVQKMELMYVNLATVLTL